MFRRLYSFLFEKILFRRQIEKIYLVFGGHIFFQTLRTAVRLRLFDLLKDDGPLQLEDIAAKLKLQTQPVRILLLGLTAVGFVKKRGSYFSNSHLADMLFVHSSPRKLVA